MSRQCLSLFHVLLFFACANCACADSDQGPRAIASVSSKGLDQVVYKGLVGNVLDGIPMDPSKRVSLQRTNAIISNTLSGRSLAVLAGLSNPVLVLGGFVWGVWAASNIQPEDDGMHGNSDASQSGRETATRDRVVALLNNGSPIAKRLPETSSAASPSPGALDEPSQVRPPVVKVWLSQRPSTPAVAR